MGRWDSMVSAETWDTLVQEYRALVDSGDDDNDFLVAELLRSTIERVEG